MATPRNKPLLQKVIAVKPRPDGKPANIRITVEPFDHHDDGRDGGVAQHPGHFDSPGAKDHGRDKKGTAQHDGGKDSAGSRR